MQKNHRLFMTCLILVMSTVTVFGQRKEEAIPQEPPRKETIFDCTAPNNIMPADNATLQLNDVLKPITFTWTPFVMERVKVFYYNIMVWEVEEGQTPFEALYNNFPLINETVTGRNNFIVRPGVIERRSASYVWRVVAVTRDGRPMCDNAQSEPTVFEVVVPAVTRVAEDDDDQEQTEDDCCSNDIVDKGKTVAVNVNIAEIEHKFSISPANVRKVSVEIISVMENTSGSNCNEESANEDWIYKFVAHNTVTWNSDAAVNGSVVNGSWYYPSRMVEWHCNKQGTIKLNLKVALPDKHSSCTRDITICVRYKFTDEDCSVCEEIVCYELKN